MKPRLQLKQVTKVQPRLRLTNRQIIIVASSFTAFLIAALIILLNFSTPQKALASGTQAIASGSFIINMGVTPQTVNNSLKPYGMIYDLMVNYQVPIIWSIEPTKAKDGKDFTYNAVDYKGGTFIVEKAYINSSVQSRITYWTGQGVSGVYTTAAVTVPIYTTLTNFPVLMIDNLSGNQNIITGYFDNAAIPSTAYIFGTPASLTNCYDVWCNPHADPNWTTHQYLYTFVTSYKGYIWGECHAVSVLESLTNPSFPYNQLNFLSTSGLQCYSANKCGAFAAHSASSTSPYTYNNSSDPIMQFMGTMSNASNNGSEKWYIPLSTGSWNTNTVRGVSTSDGASPREGALLVYGPAYNNAANGMVMYEAGHDLTSSGTTAVQVSAQRAFFNFLLLAAKSRQISLSASIPTTIWTGYTYSFSVTASGGSTPYTYQWTSSIPGTFSSPTAATTNFTAPSIPNDTTMVIKIKVTDNCGRVNFVAQNVALRKFVMLPVTLVSFTAEAINTTAVQLNWKTASETNNSYFTVERSADGKEFSEIVRVTGAGTSNLPHTYSFTDIHPLSGVSYYRLKQTNLNEASETFNVVSVTMDTRNVLTQALSVAPNPFSGSFTAQFESSEKQEVQIAMFTLSGTLVYHENFLAEEGDNRYRFITPSYFKEGTYLVKVSNEKTILATGKVLYRNY